MTLKVKHTFNLGFLVKLANIHVQQLLILAHNLLGVGKTEPIARKVTRDCVSVYPPSPDCTRCTGLIQSEVLLICFAASVRSIGDAPRGRREAWELSCPLPALARSEDGCAHEVMGDRTEACEPEKKGWKRKRRKGRVSGEKSAREKDQGS